jgi:hypothetical protein
MILGRPFIFKIVTGGFNGMVSEALGSRFDMGACVRLESRAEAFATNATLSYGILWWPYPKRKVSHGFCVRAEETNVEKDVGYHGEQRRLKVLPIPLLCHSNFLWYSL